MARSPKAGLPGSTAFPLWRVLAVSAVALATANCAQNTQKFASSSSSSRDSKYGVKASPRLYNEGDAIPKGGGRRFSGKPYVVAGRTYVPREDAKGYVREGLASWYGSAFHGRMTANGEVFDRHSIAAAHPTLPLPSYARVTNLANGHSMIVRVNDRGPYHANRVMDVSEEVAEALDFRRSGTARVRVEYAGKASTAGSDDRKLLATLRTDGAPAAIRGRSPVMMADLGPDAASEPLERLTRPERPALAFKPNPEAEMETGDAPVPMPLRPKPASTLIAGTASVAVPSALQPTAAPSHPFHPALASADTHPALPRAMAQVNHNPQGGSPLDLTPPPIRLAGAGFVTRTPLKITMAAGTAVPPMSNHRYPDRLVTFVTPSRAVGVAASVKPMPLGRSTGAMTMAPILAGVRPGMAKPIVTASATLRPGVLKVVEKPAGAPSKLAGGPTRISATTAKPAVVPSKIVAGQARPVSPSMTTSGTRSVAASRRAQLAEVY